MIINPISSTQYPISSIQYPASSTRHPDSDIAIIGLDASFGPWHSLEKVQERILGGPDPVDPESGHNWWGVQASAWYRQQGLDGFPFNGFTIRELAVPLDRFRIPPRELDEMLPQQTLMLQVAERAIRHAGLPKEARLRTGVFVGIGLDLNTTQFQLRWWLPRKAAEWAGQLGLSLSDKELFDWIASLRESIGPALTANRTMGALGGIVASRIAREFHIGGPSLTLSSEESSGVSALKTAVHFLQNRTIDYAVVGAVDLSADIRSVLGTHFGRPFSASGKIRPFQPDADGTILGEGAAAVVLKRREHAVQDNNHIYALIKGIGSASGGGVEAMVPDTAAYSTAVQRACSEAGVEPDSIQYVETHGSGCPEEDRMEMDALLKAYPFKDGKGPCPYGSVKADLGHSGTASGMASLVKLCICLEQKILPSVRNADNSLQVREINGCFFSPNRPQYWMRNREQGPRRAALSCFSVDGNCTHVVLEAVEEQDAPAEKPETGFSRTQGATLFAVEAEHGTEILSVLDQLRSRVLQISGSEMAALAEAWWNDHPADPEKPLCLSITSQDREEILKYIDFAKESLRAKPNRTITPTPNMPVSFSPEPLGKNGKVAFVFPGSGNYFPGMGRGISVRWPQIFQKQDLENSRLKDQYLPDLFWNGGAFQADSLNPVSAILGQVALGTVVSDAMGLFGVLPDAAIGYSLGESAALFALKAWTARDEMLKRMNASTLFTHDLSGPCEAARLTWGLKENEAVDWVSGVIDRPQAVVEKVLRGRKHVYLLIVNSLDECVVGGNRKSVEELVKALDCRFFPLPHVTTVHCEVAWHVKKAYRDLHLFETKAVPDLIFYSCAWARPYNINTQRAADSILAQALGTIHFPRIVQRAYQDGVRIFLEMGPGNSCTRMISSILSDKPHLAMSACHAGQDEVASVVGVLGQLLSERVPVNLDPLYAKKQSAPSRDRQEHRTLTIPLGGTPFQVPMPKHAETEKWQSTGGLSQRMPVKNPLIHMPAVPAAQAVEPILGQIEATEKAKIEAHDEYLRLTQAVTRTMSQTLSFQMALIDAAKSAPEDIHWKADKLQTAFDRTMCMEFAVGSVGKMLGPDFAVVDFHPTRVRLPDEPLMLVDRILSVEGEPGSLTHGRVITEHDIRDGAWYLDHGHIPTCIAVEAGQADLFLSGYLGIDFKTKGKAVYRLLDAIVTFHRELPMPGEVIRYDIRIDHFFRQGSTYLFKFNFEGTVNGQPLLTMKDGCAGFFTSKELEAGKGIVHTELDLRPMPGIRPDDWETFVPMTVEAYDDSQIRALRSGDLAGCFGPLFDGLGLEDPMRVPGDPMALVDRVVHLDPEGGRFGLGIIRAEADIQADDWFLTCHFVDDPVMPGTLMYECCLHTLRIFLLRMGWIGEKGGVVCGPVPGIASQLKCRGQVIEKTKKVMYEVSIKELGYMPEPYAIVDALMYADSKPIVEITDMSIRFSGLSKQTIRETWNRKNSTAAHEMHSDGVPRFDHDRILAFAVGKPSEAFGEPYRIFDRDRVIARLPGPPYQFLDRIVSIDAEPWKMKAGGVIEAQYTVPADEWYFDACGMPEKLEMPFSILLEVALQPCGWFAAYMGSALTSEIDLSFRNLGGTAVFHEPVLPDSGILTTRVKITNVSTSAGMIIQNYEFDVRNEGRLVYKGDTNFGFFTKQALTDQVGIRDASPYEPGPAEMDIGLRFDYPKGIFFPEKKLRMVDRIDLFLPNGGPHGLGFISGTKDIDPEEWFFKAHFFQDPVCPGSLGLESFLQVLKVVAVNRWGIGVWVEDSGVRSDKSRIKKLALAPGNKHSWLYRGQVIPSDTRVTVQAFVTSVDDQNHRMTADGFLMVDGRTIYQMEGFEIEAEM